MRIVVMGVSGSGKSTLGAALAQALGATFIDADDLHPAGNIAQMRAGIALTDAARWPWLDLCATAMAQAPRVVLACSCLKRSYRDRLRGALPDLRLVYLDVTPAVVAERMAARQGHFMPLTLLDSQFAILEVPQADENPFRIAGDLDVAEQAARLVGAFGAGRTP